MKKPEFNIEEIKAEVKGLPVIEENMKQALDFAYNLENYYSKIIFQEEDIKQAKEEKANINKLKTKIDDIRKEVTKEYNKPLEDFINIAKETTAVLSTAYNTINMQVYTFESEKIFEKTKELEVFFEEQLEYLVPSLADKIKFTDLEIKVNLSTSLTKLKNEVLEKLQKIANDIELIKLEEYSEEIQLEYLKNKFDFTNAKLIVLNRKMELDKIAQDRIKLEEMAKEEEKVIDRVNEVLAPTEVLGDWTTNEVKFIPKVSLTLYDIPDYMVGELKKWLEERGIKYE